LNREQLINEIRDLLAKTGFYLSDKANTRGMSFDIIARRDQNLLLIKVLANVDAFTERNAGELKLIARTLSGSPILVGQRSGGGRLEEGVIYSRFGVPILSKETFVDFFAEGVPPFVFSAPGGLYVRLDGDLLRQLRDTKNISLGTLAEVAGVSRRTVQMYLEGMSATIDIALRLEEFFGEPLVIPVDPFAYTKDLEQALVSWNEFDTFEKHVFQKLQNLGFEVLPTLRCPFEALTSDREEIYLTGVRARNENVEEKVTIVSNISKVAERDSVVFVEKSRVRMSIRGTPIINKDELRKIKEREEIQDLIEERKK
jgi:putative transcriptional regulator